MAKSKGECRPQTDKVDRGVGGGELAHRRSSYLFHWTGSATGNPTWVRATCNASRMASRMGKKQLTGSKNQQQRQCLSCGGGQR